MAIRYAIIEAPSSLGLWPSGVQDAPRTLIELGLGVGLGVEAFRRVEPPPYDPRRDADTHLLNPAALRAYAINLAMAVTEVMNDGQFPLVLGGDCSILLGPALALKQTGRHGLLFLDGHMDYWDAGLEPYGEAASMDLALVTGAGPALLSNIFGIGPYFDAADCFAYGTRDHLYSDDFIDSPFPSVLQRFDVNEVHALGARGVEQALVRVTAPGTKGFWIHFDVDVLDDRVMPAVDYRMKEGLSWDELSLVLDAALATGKALGMTLTIYNPNLDPSRSIARALVARLVDTLIRRR
jgi:arginase